MWFNLNGQMAAISDTYVSIDGFHLSQQIENNTLDRVTTPLTDRLIGQVQSPTVRTIVDTMRKSVILNDRLMVQLTGRIDLFPEICRKLSNPLIADIEQKIKTIEDKYSLQLERGEIDFIACYTSDDLNYKEVLSKGSLIRSEYGYKFHGIGSGSQAENIARLDHLLSMSVKQYAAHPAKSGRFFAQSIAGALLFDEILNPKIHQQLSYGGGYDAMYINNDGLWKYCGDTAYLFGWVYQVRGTYYLKMYPHAVFQSYLEDRTVRLTAPVNRPKTMLPSTLVQALDPIRRSTANELPKGFSPFNCEFAVLSLVHVSEPVENWSTPGPGTVSKGKQHILLTNPDQFNTCNLADVEFRVNNGQYTFSDIQIEPDLNMIVTSLGVKRVYDEKAKIPERFADLEGIITDLRSNDYLLTNN
jgi:hypothetical protein